MKIEKGREEHGSGKKATEQILKMEEGRKEHGSGRKVRRNLEGRGW